MDLLEYRDAYNAGLSCKPLPARFKGDPAAIEAHAAGRKAWSELPGYVAGGRKRMKPLPGQRR